MLHHQHRPMRIVEVTGGKRGRHTAFSLVELLVVVGIIALLVSILMPTLSKARKEARKVACASNLRQIMMAAVGYAQNEGNGILLPGRLYNQEDSFEVLYPRYLPDMRVFVCPATDNVVTTIAHVRNNAPGGANDSSGGHSYEIRSFAWRGFIWPDGTSSLLDEFMISTRRCKDPSKAGIVMDADDPDGTPDDLNNWPSTTDNHGAEGENIGFADGHAEWCRPGRPILEAFMGSYYDPGLSYGGIPASITNQYGLQLQGNKFVWMW